MDGSGRSSQSLPWNQEISEKIIPGSQSLIKSSCRAQPIHSLSLSHRQSNNTILDQSPQSIVPSESGEEQPEFFDQILIKNIIHIDHKINEIKKITSHSNYDVRQLSLAVAENNKNLLNMLPDSEKVPTILVNDMKELKNQVEKIQQLLEVTKDKGKANSVTETHQILTELQQLRKDLFS